MTANLVSQLQDEFSDDVISKVAAFLGETPGRTRSALGTAIPAVVGGLFLKAQTRDGANDLFAILQRGGFDGKGFGSLASLFRSASAPLDLVKSGGPLLFPLFGPRQDKVMDTIASTSGLDKQKTTSLLALATSFIASLVGKEASALGGFSIGSLTGLLKEQGAYLTRAASPGLLQVLGLSSWGDPVRVASGPARAYPTETRVSHEPARAYVQPETRGGLGWLTWAIPLLLLGVFFFAWRSWRTEPVRTVATNVPASPRAGLPAATPALVTRTLTCGQALDVAPSGVEDKLIAFIDDRTRKADNTSWFSFDRLEFETASATLKPGSQAQLRNIAEIMKCYPNVDLKVGGYTDNVGDPASNLKLSQARAENTMAAIVAHGIPASRLSAEGFGEQYPPAGNDTEEGRQRNRRIDVRVMKK